MSNNKNFKVKEGIKSTSFTSQINQVTKNTVPYDLRFDLSFYKASAFSSFTEITAISFKPDGTKFFGLDNSGLEIIQVRLSSAWDIETQTGAVLSIDVSSQTTNPQGMFVNPDGDSLYLIDSTSSVIYQYEMSTAWDLSFLSYTGNTFSVSSQESSARGLAFNPDGTKMYVIGQTNNTIYQYSLSSAWDITTASYDSVSVDLSGTVTLSENLSFSNDGLKVFVSDSSVGLEEIYQFDLTTAWDITTAAYSSKSFSGDYVFEFQSGGEYIFTANSNIVFKRISSYDTADVDVLEGDVQELSLSKNTDLTFTNVPTEYSRSELIMNFESAAVGLEGIGKGSLAYSANFPDATRQDPCFFISKDGTHVYTHLRISVYNYSGTYVLDTPWDLRTATRTQAFGGTSSTNPYWALNWSEDGSVYFNLNPNTYNIIYQKNPTTPFVQVSGNTTTFDISTIMTPAENYTNMVVDSSGTHLYLSSGVTPCEISQFVLSTPWDLSTISYVGTRTGMSPINWISDDGTQVLCLDGLRKMSSPFNVSSLSGIIDTYGIPRLLFGKQGSLSNGFYVATNTSQSSAVQEISNSGDATINYLDSITWYGDTLTVPASGKETLVSFTTNNSGADWEGVKILEGTPNV